MATTLYDFPLRRIDGTSTTLGNYRGNVLLLVNVASQCGLTPQYTALEALHQAYHNRGLRVLGFPANNFGAQEPGSDEEIQTFCSTRYDVHFDLFAKLSVKGDDINPLYAYLTSLPEPLGGEIEWNFGKFLVGRDGTVLARFSPRTAPDDPALLAALEAALG